MSPTADLRKGAASRAMAQMGAMGVRSAGRVAVSPAAEDKTEVPRLSSTGALLTVAVSTTLDAFCSEFMVSSFEDGTSSGYLSTTFVGLVLFPILGNAAEHATAFMVAFKDKIDLFTSIAFDGSVQIAPFVLPLAVVIGWALDNDCMTVYFDTF